MSLSAECMMKAMRRRIALKAPRAKSLETYHRFAQAFGVRACLRVALRSLSREGDPSR